MADIVRSLSNAKGDIVNSLKDELLLQIQKNFPLVEKPYSVIAERLGVKEGDVLSLLKDQKDKNIIREISPIYDTKKLGYKSSLVAFKVSSGDIDSVTRWINSHPGVSHNYERDHEFNIWFTIAVSPDSRIGLNRSVEIIAKRSGVSEYILLPTLKMFKISVKLDTTGKEKERESIKKMVYDDIELSSDLKLFIKESQYDLPIVSEPFLELKKRLGISYKELFDRFKMLQQGGYMRRFAAILNHKRAGFNANAMVVWDVDEKEGEKIGQKAAEFRAVSHCYLRPKYPNWRYNLFTMVHAKTKDESKNIIEKMAKEIEHYSKRELYSTREFKKVRLRYFTQEFKEWEEVAING